MSLILTRFVVTCKVHLIISATNHRRLVILMKSALSIQSHVVHGYVGGRAAVFPLQTLGWDVDTVNTVNFSNHTGYGSVRGSKLSSEEIKELLEGICEIGVKYQAIFTGYIPNAELITVIGSYISRVKQSQEVMYLLDPVMGDQGYLYVEKSCVDEYRKLLERGIVDVVTPNQFELELLCDKSIHSLSDLKHSIKLIHEKYQVKYVVVSLVVGLDGLDDKYIYCAILAGTGVVEMFQVPLIKSYFTGVGDLFSALLVDRLHKHSNEGVGTKDSMKVLRASVGQVLTVVAKTLKLTHTLGSRAAQQSGQTAGTMNDGASMKYFELRIIQARDFYGYDGEGEYRSVELDKFIQ